MSDQDEAAEILSIAIYNCFSSCSYRKSILSRNGNRDQEFPIASRKSYVMGRPIRRVENRIVVT